MNHQNKLLCLVAQLQGCAPRDRQALRESASGAWETLRSQKLSDLNRPSSAVMAAVVINSDVVGQLLTLEERAELLRLAEVALERYQQQTHPPNKLGNLIAGILKES